MKYAKNEPIEELLKQRLISGSSMNFVDET